MAEVVKWEPCVRNITYSRTQEKIRKPQYSGKTNNMKEVRTITNSIETKVIVKG